MIRAAMTIAGGLALTALGGGVASAAPLIAEPPTAPAEAPVAGNPVWVTDHVPVPIEDPTFGVFEVLAPVYGALGGIN